MHAKTNHASAHVRDDISIPTRVSDDISSPTRVNDDICNPARVSDDIREPIKLWHMSPIKLRHMSLTNPQTPINRSLLKAFLRTKTHQEIWGHQDILREKTKPSRAQAALKKIQKYQNSTGIKPWSLQELQELRPQMQGTFKAESSKLPA